MDFTIKYKEYKKVKYNLNNIIKENKNIFFGSGGSSNIIIVSDNIVIKIIPEFKQSPLNKTSSNNDIKEIEFYKFFTSEFLKPNITPHIVGYYSDYKIFDIKTLLPNDCLTLDEKLFTKPEDIDFISERLCDLSEKYNHAILKPEANFVVLEYCPYNITMFAETIIHQEYYPKYYQLANFIHRIIFQFMYTMASIQKKYPNFIHNDMFLRNILGIIEENYKDNDYVEYVYDNISYYLLANGFYLKINDFGYSLNVPYITSTLELEIKSNPLSSFEISNPKRDVYTFLYDLYNGANFGTKSIMMLINEENNEVKDFIKSQFNKYIDINSIDEIQEHNKILLDWIWNIQESQVLQSTVKIPNEYFKDKIFDQFTSLPNNSNIVKTFKFSN